MAGDTRGATGVAQDLLPSGLPGAFKMNDNADRLAAEVVVILMIFLLAGGRVL